MSLVQKCKSIDQISKHLTYGYIREATKNITYTTIPIMIPYICLLYYYLVPEKFIKGCGLQIYSSDKKDAHKSNVVKTCDRTHVWHNAHGSVIINAAKNPNAVAIWTLKVNKCKDSSNFIIGIHSVFDKNSVEYGKGDNRYGWWGSGYKIVNGIALSRTVDTFENGDVITMELNIPDKTLLFYKNKKRSKNFTIDHIDVTATYHLVVRLFRSMFASGIVSIIDFDIKNYNCLDFKKE